MDFLATVIAMSFGAFLGQSILPNMWSILCKNWHSFYDNWIRELKRCRIWSELPQDIKDCLWILAKIGHNAPNLPWSDLPKQSRHAIRDAATRLLVNGGIMDYFNSILPADDDRHEIFLDYFERKEGGIADKHKLVGLGLIGAHSCEYMDRYMIDAVYEAMVCVHEHQKAIRCFVVTQ